MIILFAFLVWGDAFAAYSRDEYLRRQFDPTQITIEWSADREAWAARFLDEDKQPILADLAWTLLAPGQRAEAALEVEIEKVVDRIAFSLVAAAAVT